MSRSETAYPAAPPNQNPGTILHYAAYRAIDWLASHTPLPLQYKLADFASDAYWKLDATAREGLLANLRAVSGERATPAEVRALTRRAFRSFGRYLTEFIGSHSLRPEFIDTQVRVTGREHIDAGLARGRGVIICSGHYSNWELGCATVPRLGFPITAIVQQHSIARIDEIFVARRAKAGVKVVHSQHGPLSALKALRCNETVAILGDRPTGGPTVSVEFFGRRTKFPQGPWRLARLSGAPILPTFVCREGSNYTLNFGAPLDVSGYNDDSVTVRELAQAWAKCFEARVRGDPSQWAAFYPVWSSNEFER